MACKWIVGASHFLDVAHEAWQRHYPNLHIEKIVLPRTALDEFDFSALDQINPETDTAFAAVDDSFASFSRLEVMRLLMERRVKLNPFISPLAMIASNVHIGLNAFIGDGAIVGHDSQIHYNTILLPGARIGAGGHIRSSCWMESGVVVGDHVRIGAHSTLRKGVLIADKVKVGRSCELGWPQLYDKNIAEKTIFDRRYDRPIYTYQYL